MSTKVTNCVDISWKFPLSLLLNYNMFFLVSVISHCPLCTDTITYVLTDFAKGVY